MTLLIFLVAALWVAVLVLAALVWVMLRQIGVLYERVAPVGALMDSAGPQVGEASPSFALASLNGGDLVIGEAGSRAQLVFFLSPTCPVCKQLLPVLAGIRADERGWLDVILASDGDAAKHVEFIAARKLSAFPYVLSADLGMSFHVRRRRRGPRQGPDQQPRAAGEPVHRPSRGRGLASAICRLQCGVRPGSGE
jgi:methylamine dehydrogenase accessory protein MauD